MSLYQNSLDSSIASFEFNNITSSCRYLTYSEDFEVMLLPSHVEALRCMMVERLWKESMSIGPLPELMSDIMAYTPKPTLTLDCPMEEIVLETNNYIHYCKEACMMFHDSGVLYGVYMKGDDIICNNILSHNREARVVTTVYGIPLYYFDRDTGHLFILHETGRGDVIILTDYDVKADKSIKHEMKQLSDVFNAAEHITATGNHLFVGVQWMRAEGKDSFEVMYLNTEYDENPRVIWSTYDRGNVLVTLSVVSVNPVTLDIVYSTTNSTTQSSRLVLERSSPIVEFTVKPSSKGVRPSIRKTRSGYIIHDSRLKRMSQVLNLPGNPLGTLCTTDKSGGMYFLVKRKLGVKNSQRIIRAFPYLN